MNDPSAGAKMEERMAAAIANTRNLGEMPDADVVGMNGDECGDLLRMWVKFREEDGRKVIDRATFQTFGCQTAIAVASVATEMIRGKTVEEALDLSGETLASPLGALPPMKIHCAQLVEGALRDALTSGKPPSASAANPPGAPGEISNGGAAKTAGGTNLVDALERDPAASVKQRIVLR